MSNLPKILPCPFCGGPATLEEIPCIMPGAEVSFSVSCDSKDEAHCMGYCPSTTFADRAEAIKAWNRRAPIEAKV